MRRITVSALNFTIQPFLMHFSAQGEKLLEYVNKAVERI